MICPTKESGGFCEVRQHDSARRTMADLIEAGLS
jgi:hypothetical protein